MKMKPGMTIDGARWAFRLVEREASGEQIETISREAWREVLGFDKDTTARQALESINKTRAAA